PRSLTRRLVARRELPFEFAMNGFRLVDGFAEDLFSERTGLGPLALDDARRRKASAFSTTYWLSCCPTAKLPNQSRAPCPDRGRFYSQTPHPGPLNKGITACFNPVAG